MRATSLLAALTFCAGAHAADLEIKGIKVDAPADCSLIHSLEVRGGSFYPACENHRPSFMVEASFLDGTSVLMIEQTAEGIVKSVAVKGFSYAAALDALTLKFGQPSIERSKIQNRMGATFEQEEATWSQGSQILLLRRHSTKIDSPSLMLIGETMRSESRRERDRRATQGAKNI